MYSNFCSKVNSPATGHCFHVFKKTKNLLVNGEEWYYLKDGVVFSVIVVYNICIYGKEYTLVISAFMY